MPCDDELPCEDAIQQLDDYLDGEVESEQLETINRHLERCAPCADEYRYEESVVKGIRRKLAEITIPDDLRQRVLNKLERFESG